MYVLNVQYTIKKIQLVVIKGVTFKQMGILGMCTHTHNSHGLWLTTDHRNLFCENLEAQFRLKIIKHYCYTLH